MSGSPCAVGLLGLGLMSTETNIIPLAAAAGVSYLTREQEASVRKNIGPQEPRQDIPLGEHQQFITDTMYVRVSCCCNVSCAIPSINTTRFRRQYRLLTDTHGT